MNAAAVLRFRQVKGHHFRCHPQKTSGHKPSNIFLLLGLSAFFLPTTLAGSVSFFTMDANGPLPKFIKYSRLLLIILQGLCRKSSNIQKVAHPAFLVAGLNLSHATGRYACSECVKFRVSSWQILSLIEFYYGIRP